MPKDNIFLIGRGHLGRFLAERWGLSEDCWWRDEMEALREDHLQSIGRRIVVNCAGKTDLPWCEKNALEAFRCNVSAPIQVLRTALAAYGEGAPYIHLSSGCVWDGPYKQDGTPFGPDDPPHPACFYSWTKCTTDAMLLREGGSQVVCLRPRQVFSPAVSSRNTLAKLVSYRCLLETPNTMTSAATIAATIEAIVQGSGDPFWGRIVNVYDRGVTSPYKVGLLLAEMELREKPEPLEKSELDAWHKPKRVDTVLIDPLFESIIKPGTVEEALRRDIKAYAQNCKRKGA